MKKLLNFGALSSILADDEHPSLFRYINDAPEAIWAVSKRDGTRFGNPAFHEMFPKATHHFFDQLQQHLSTDKKSCDVTLADANKKRSFQVTCLDSMFPSDTVHFGVVTEQTTKQFLEEQHRFDSYRHLFGHLDGLAFFEFHLETHQFETFGALQQMFGLSSISSDTQSPLLFKQLLHPDDLNSYLSVLGELMIDPEMDTRTSTVRIFHLKESLYRTFTVVSHLSENRKQLTCAVYDQSLHQADEIKLKQLSQFVEAAMMEFDFTTDTFRYVSPGLFQMIGFEVEPESITLDFWRQLLHPEDMVLLIASREETLRGVAATYVYRAYVMDELKWVEERREPLFGPEKTVVGYRSLLKNITRVFEQEQEITSLRTVDPLTGTANRESLRDYVQELIDDQLPMTLIGVSFNHYTEVNQTLGFEFADEWTSITTAALQPLIPEGALLAWISEDVYCVVLPTHWTDEEARRFGERVLGLSKHPFVIGEYEVFTTLSVGVCRYPHDGQTVNDLLNHTVHVTNHAYTQGAPYLAFYSSNVDLPSLRRYALITDLRNAIKQRELHVVYQPKVDAWTGRITGAEALMRWQHPTWGAVSPAEFIPLIEHNHQFVELTDFLIEEVCLFLSRLSSPVPISINVPVHYFYRDDYLTHIHATLEHYQLAPEYLEIEIPESTLLENRERMKVIFETLNAFGLHVSFDDFGKGYSSLAYVQDYNVQTVKIDRVFAHGVHQNIKSQAIVRSLMYIAKEFGMHVVVEGVECFRDLTWLRDHDVKTIQGYLFSPPVEASLMEELLEQECIPPTEVSSLDGHTLLIPVHMLFSRIQSFSTDLGRAPALVSVSSDGQLELYTTLYLPPDRFLEFSLLMKPSELPIPVSIIARQDAVDGIYTYIVEHDNDDIIQLAMPQGFHLTATQAKDMLRLKKLL